MKHVMTISSLLLSQLIAASPDGGGAASGAAEGAVSAAPMTAYQKQGNALLVEYRTMMQGIDSTFDIQVVKEPNLPACFSSVDPIIQSKLLTTSDIVKKIKDAPGAKPLLLAYCANVLIRLEAIDLMMKTRAAEEKRVREAQALAENERMAALAAQGLFGDDKADAAAAAAAGGATSTTVAAAVEAGATASTTTIATLATVVPGNVVDASVATAAAAGGAAAAAQGLSPFDRATTVGREKLGKICPALFSPSDGIGLVSWWTQREYNAVRSPALVNLAIPFLGSLSEEASYVEFKGEEAARVVGLIQVFKAAFRNSSGVPFSGSQEASFLTEKQADRVTTYTLIVKANVGDAPAETIIIEVDRTEPENLVVKGSTPEMKTLTKAVFS